MASEVVIINDKNVSNPYHLQTLNITEHKTTISLFTLYGCETQSLTVNEGVSEVCIIYYVPSIHNIHQDKMQ